MRKTFKSLWSDTNTCVDDLDNILATNLATVQQESCNWKRDHSLAIKQSLTSKTFSRQKWITDLNICFGNPLGIPIIEGLENSEMLTKLVNTIIIIYMCEFPLYIMFRMEFRAVIRLDKGLESIHLCSKLKQLEWVGPARFEIEMDNSL